MKPRSFRIVGASHCKLFIEYIAKHNVEYPVDVGIRSRSVFSEELTTAFWKHFLDDDFVPSEDTVDNLDRDLLAIEFLRRELNYQLALDEYKKAREKLDVANREHDEMWYLGCKMAKGQEFVFDDIKITFGDGMGTYVEKIECLQKNKTAEQNTF